MVPRPALADVSIRSGTSTNSFRLPVISPLAIRYTLHPALASLPYTILSGYRFKLWIVK